MVRVTEWDYWVVLFVTKSGLWMVVASLEYYLVLLVKSEGQAVSELRDLYLAAEAEVEADYWLVVEVVDSDFSFHYSHLTAVVSVDLMV